MNSASAVRVWSNKPIMVALITRSADITPTAKIGDPAMLVVPSTVSWLRRCALNTSARARSTISFVFCVHRKVVAMQ